MNVQQIRDNARSFSIKTSRGRKTDLIRNIQVAEGSINFFGSAINGFCDQSSCLWRVDCLANSK